MRCLLCLATVPDDTSRCPKCGGTILQSDNAFDGPLRNVIQLYSSPLPFYVKAKPPTVINGELASFETEWKLYRVKLQQNAPSIFLWDRDGYLPGKQEASLHLVEGEDLANILAALPEKKIREMESVLRDEWGILIKKEDGQSLLDILPSHPIIFEPVPKLKNPAVLKEMDWRAYVEHLACPKTGKDPMLTKVHTAKILIPLHMRYAPHSLEITNSNTGKTRFYDSAGVKVDRATRRAVLGFAKSPVEVYPGTIHGSSLPTAFDQIESQDSYELAKYMLDILETGRALVDSGGVRFVVETNSSFAYLGNPVAKDAKVVEGFKALLNHICANPAMGRRFGIILFATDLKTISGNEKMSLQELEEWKRSFTLFRAVEEYAQPKLKQLIRDLKVAEWLHQPIKGYKETIYKATEELEDYNLASFFESHAEAEHRVRGAALHAACALLLDKIALNEISTDEILEEAEDLLPEYVNINLKSIATLCQMWDKLREEQALTCFENLADYMKEIISACILYKKQVPNAVNVKLDRIPYEPGNRSTYTHFSKCIDRLRRKRKIDNETLRNFFGFQIISENGTFVVEYFENPKPPEALKPIGFLNFSNFSISQPPQTGSEEQEEQEQKAGVSQNIEKLRKLRNGEEPQCLLSVVKLTCQVVDTCSMCGFQGRMAWQANLKSGRWALLCESCGQFFEEAAV